MTTETSPSARNEQASCPAALLEENRSIAGDGDEISLLDILIVLAERKRLIFWITAVFAGIGIAISLLLPVRYTATVAVLPPQQNSSMGAALASQLSAMGGAAALAGGSLGLKNPNDLFIGMAKSRTVEDAMVKQFHLQEKYHKAYLSDARKSFESHVTIDGSGKDGLIHISVEDQNAVDASEMANGYVEQFRDLSEHLAITEASQRRLFFERELEQAKNKLEGAEEALKQTEQTTGVIQLDSQSRALIESAASLRAQITTREVQIQGLQTYATGENAQLVQAQRELSVLRAQLAKLGGSEDSASGGMIVPKGRVPEAGLEYVRKMREVKYNEAIFDILARQFEVAKLDEAKEGALIQVVDPAVVPEKRSFPKRGLLVAAAVVSGFILGCFAVLLLAGFKRTKSLPETRLKLAHLRSAISLGQLKAG